MTKNRSFSSAGLATKTLIIFFFFFFSKKKKLVRSDVFTFSQRFFAFFRKSSIRSYSFFVQSLVSGGEKIMVLHFCRKFTNGPFWAKLNQIWPKYGHFWPDSQIFHNFDRQKFWFFFKNRKKDKKFCLKLMFFAFFRGKNQNYFWYLATLGIVSVRTAVQHSFSQKPLNRFFWNFILS